jgi:hypothetical protein
MSTQGPKKPDFRLKFLHKVTSEKGDVGAGWQNNDGSISIRLNCCVHLVQNPDVVLTLFKNNYEPRVIPPLSSSHNAPPPREDDVPF